MYRRPARNIEQVRRDCGSRIPENTQGAVRAFCECCAMYLSSHLSLTRRLRRESLQAPRMLITIPSPTHSRPQSTDEQCRAGPKDCKSQLGEEEIQAALLRWHRTFVSPSLRTQQIIQLHHTAPTLLAGSSSNVGMYRQKRAQWPLARRRRGKIVPSWLRHPVFLSRDLCRFYLPTSFCNFTWKSYCSASC